MLIASISTKSKVFCKEKKGMLVFRERGDRRVSIPHVCVCVFVYGCVCVKSSVFKERRRLKQNRCDAMWPEGKEQCND